MADNTHRSSNAAAPRTYVPRGQMKFLARETVLEELGPSRLAIIGLTLIFALLIGAVAWSYIVPVSTSTRTKGEVVPTGNQRIVQHLEGGIVRDILVHDGDTVFRGQVLIRFDGTQRDAELGQMRAREAALSIRELRLRAQINNTEPDFGAYADTFPVLVEEATVALAAARARVDGQSLVLKSKITQREKSVEIYEEQAASLRGQVKLVREAVDMRESLFKSGHGSRVNVITALLELSKVEGALAEARSSAGQAEVSIQESENELNELLVTERSKTLEELSGVLGELAEVRENLLRLEDRVERLAVRAPVAGFVHSLKVNTSGAVVQPAATLLTIIPSDEQLVVETEIDPKDIGHVAIGQSTKVVVNGFDQRRYGHVAGKLIQVSPTTLINDKGDPYFKGRIELAESVIRQGDNTQPILPGMTVTADIITGEQSLLRYLTGPIYVALATSFSER